MKATFSLASLAYIPFSPAVGDFHHTATVFQSSDRSEKIDVHVGEVQLQANSHDLSMCYKDLGLSLQCTGLLPMVL